MLILAREFASNLATPIYIADAEDRLVYFNEPAEQIAGRSFAETGEIRSASSRRCSRRRPWTASPCGAKTSPPASPPSAAPRTAASVSPGLDGIRREIATTAFPLFGPDDGIPRIMVIFWEQG